MLNPEERQIIEFDRLNRLGKTVFIAGVAVKTTVAFIDTALEKVVDLVLEAERAFKEGLDAPVENAKILEEWEDEDSNDE